jgi:AraC-like DNA-binding protein
MQVDPLTALELVAHDSGLQPDGASREQRRHEPCSVSPLGELHVAELRMTRSTPQARYALRVQELLVERAPARVNMSAVAGALGLSVRTLRRRLVAEGKSYLDVEHEALALVARRLLRDQQHTIQEAAHAMGFSDATTFHRAFKRWTGTTPSAFRNRPSGRAQGSVVPGPKRA